MQKHEIRNVGWTLGNDCPYRCRHCYSSIARNRGRNLETRDADRIIGQLRGIGVKTVNLGGNEPIFTGGLDPRDTILPYIIRKLHESGIAVGLTTAGISLIYLDRLYPDSIALLNDIDISLDSPFADEHDSNRGARLFHVALRALGICADYGLDRTIVVCGMNWNLSERHLDALVDMARSRGALLRINFMKPTEGRHMELVPDAETFYRVCHRLFTRCHVVEMGEPIGSAMSGESSRGCPCGTSSFRINSITPDGRVPVSPCVYAHDFKTGDLLVDDLADIITSPEFVAFRERRANPASIGECRGCEHLARCRGGCAARAHLWAKFQSRDVSIKNARDPYCLKDYGASGLCAETQKSKQDTVLVHRDYLCTIVLDPF